MLRFVCLKNIFPIPQIPTKPLLLGGFFCNMFFLLKNYYICNIKSCKDARYSKKMIVKSGLKYQNALTDIVVG